MDKIRLRNIIDQAQAKLAHEARLVPDQDTTSGSVRWREKLPYGGLAKRLKAAKKTLRDAGRPSEALSDLLQSTEGLNLVSEQNSRMRQLGDSVAHEPITYSDLDPYLGSISRLEDDCDDVEDTRRGLDDLMDFILAP